MAMADVEDSVTLGLAPLPQDRSLLESAKDLYEAQLILAFDAVLGQDREDVLRRG